MSNIIIPNLDHNYVFSSYTEDEGDVYKRYFTVLNADTNEEIDLDYSPWRFGPSRQCWKILCKYDFPKRRMFSIVNPIEDVDVLMYSMFDCPVDDWSQLNM